MKTNLTEKDGVLHRLSRLSKVLLFAGVASLMAIPQADARPGRGRDHDRRGGYDRHHHHESRFHRHHRPIPRPVYHRGWSRPGWYGSYPPAGYVDYRYIHSLPRGYRTVYRNGHRYYYANGSYYWPARYQNRGVFISVRF
jgi:Ni/Co efflux regulator RcnB